MSYSARDHLRQNVGQPSNTLDDRDRIVCVYEGECSDKRTVVSRTIGK